MLDEAIDVFKRLRTKYPAEPPVTSKQLDMALLLGIEALERLKYLRDGRYALSYKAMIDRIMTPLPSETEGVKE